MGKRYAHSLKGLARKRISMNFTVCNHSKARDASQYIHYPNVEFEDITDMTTSGLNYCACKLKDEYRLDNNFEGYVDVLIVDIDEKCTLEMAEILFKKYEYIIITTKSHQKDKGGTVCDRFRIFFPLDKTIHIREKMEEIYNRFCELHPYIDTSCKNVSRHFYSSPKDAIIKYNQGKKYCTDTTEIEDAPIQEDVKIQPCVEFKIVKWLGREVRVLVNPIEYVESDGGGLDEEAHLKGIDKYLEENYYQGNKSICLFNSACMMRSDGFSLDDTMNYLINYWQSKASRGDKMSSATQNIKGAYKL